MKPRKEEAAEGRNLGDLAKHTELASLDNATDESEQEQTEWVVEEIDWNNDPAVILHDQAATAAYFNRAGELVIKQRDTLGTDGVIYVAPENVEKFVHGLRDRALPALKKKLRVVEGGE
jgi:hypothetical protein